MSAVREQINNPSPRVDGISSAGFVVQLVRTLDFESKNLSSNLSLVTIVCSEMVSCFPSKEVAGVRFPSDENFILILS